MGIVMWRRLKRVGVFAGIVLGIAASFVAADFFALRTADRIFEWRVTAGSNVVPNRLRTSTSCRAAVAGAKTRVPPPARAAAWLLGVNAGVYTRAALMTPQSDRRSVEDPQSIPSAPGRLAAQADAKVRRFAEVLDVPPPPPFKPVDVARSNIEFVTFIERDANDTAIKLAATFGTDGCELYKLGTYWGYSIFTRAAVPGERNIYAAEIRYYAERRSIPPAVWQEMIGRTDANARTTDLAAQSDVLTNRVTKLLSTGE